MTPGGVYGGSGASYAPGVLPVLPPLPEPEEAYRGMYVFFFSFLFATDTPEG